MDKVQFWSYISSIVTCVSLLLYMVGNYISVILAKRYNGELFIWNPNEEILKNYYLIHYEEGDSPSEDNSDKLMIASDNFLLNVRAYNVRYEKSVFNRYNIKKGSEIFSYDRLSPRECIIVSSILPEGIPNILLEWETPTYMRASMTLHYDGNTGNVCEKIKYKHTFKSIILYLFDK